MEHAPNGYITKHRQIVETLNEEIQQERLKPYDLLPSEKELCTRWQASRSTIRKAMDQLADRGTIFRVPGKGSFVAFPKILHPTSHILSFTEKMKAQGFEVETKLIGREIVEARDEIAAALKLALSARVLRIQRLRIVKSEPVVLQTAFMPAYLCENLMKEDLESKSLNHLLQQQCNVRLSRSDIWVEAPMVTPKERKLLGNPRVPLFLAVVGVTFDQNNHPIRISRGIFRGDRMRLKICDSGVFELESSSLLG